MGLSPADIKHGVLKHGLGYDLVIVTENQRVVLGIRCHTCGRVSYHPKDITERFCAACHVFHEEPLLPMSGAV